MHNWVPNIEADLCAITAGYTFVAVTKNKATVDGINYVEHTDTISSVATHPTDSTMFATGSVDGMVRLHSECPPSAVLCVTSGAIRSLSFSPSGEVLAIGGDSLRVTTAPPTVLPQTRPATHISTLWLEKRPDTLVSLCDDGHLRLFDVAKASLLQDTPVEMGSWMKRDMTHVVRMGLTVYKGDEYIGIPTGQCVTVFQVATSLSSQTALRPVLKMQTEAMRSPFSVCFITHKKAVIADSVGNVLHVFKINLKKGKAGVVEPIDCGEKSLQVLEGRGAHLVVSTVDRALCILKVSSKVASKEEKDDPPTEDEDLPRVVKDLTKDLGPSPKGPRRRKAERSQTKSEPPKRNYVDDECEEGDDNESEPDSEEGFEEAEEETKPWRPKTTIKPQPVRNPLFDDESEEAGRDAESLPGDVDPEPEEEILSQERTATPGRDAVETRALPKMHPLVPIGGTPPSETGCYLCYNTFGFISKSAEVVTVHFHDVSRLPVRIADQHGFHTAALGMNGAIFASSTAISYKAFQSIGTNADWQVQFSPGEEVELVAVGIRFCIASTSRFLRVFTHTGIEMSIVHPRGKIVCLTCSVASKSVEADLLAVVYCDPHSVSLRLAIYHVAAQSEQISCQLPHEELSWMGWSEDGCFYVLDIRGVMSMLSTAWGGSWLPVYDPVHYPEDERYWVWGVSDGALLVHVLQHHEDYFPTYGSVRGAVHVPMVMPVANTGTENQKAQREWVLRNGAKLRELKNKSKSYSEDIARKDIRIDRVLYETFCLCVENDQTARALDISCTFELRATMEEAIRFCHSQQQTVLMEKLHAVLKQRFKRKRLCDLPDPGTEITERDKDALFRKVIAWEKERQKQQTTASTPHSALVPVEVILPPQLPIQVPPLHNSPPAALPPAKEARMDKVDSVHHSLPKGPSQISAPPLSTPSGMSALTTPQKSIQPPAAFKRVEAASPVIRSGDALQNIVGAVVSNACEKENIPQPVPKFDAPKRATTVLRKKVPAPTETTSMPSVVVKEGLGSVALAALSKRHRDNEDDD